MCRFMLIVDIFGLLSGQIIGKNVPAIHRRCDCNARKCSLPFINNASMSFPVINDEYMFCCYPSRSFPLQSISCVRLLVGGLLFKYCVVACSLRVHFFHFLRRWFRFERFITVLWLESITYEPRRLVFRVTRSSSPPNAQVKTTQTDRGCHSCVRWSVNRTKRSKVIRLPDGRVGAWYCIKLYSWDSRRRRVFDHVLSLRQFDFVRSGFFFFHFRLTHGGAFAIMLPPHHFRSPVSRCTFLPWSIGYTSAILIVVLLWYSR